MMDSANTDLEMQGWLRWAAEGGNTPIFVRTVAEATLLASMPDYVLLRPVLVELKRRYPEGILKADRDRISQKGIPHEMAEARRAYVTFCEKRLWRPWKADESLDVPRPFDDTAMPEPYIFFSDKEQRVNLEIDGRLLIVLLTNPGRTMRHQRRSALNTGHLPTENDSYCEAASKLGRFYGDKLRGRPTGNRIQSMLELSRLLSCAGVLQVEALPFHSESLPQKHRGTFLQKVNNHKLLGAYIQLLKAFLRHADQPVVILQGSNSPARRPTSPWLTWIADVAGLDLSAAERTSLVVKKGSRATVTAWVSGPPPKGLVLMMGGNRLPADEGLRKLAAELQKP